ncbi:unnamed protein product [Musa acuminata var. zebrina]
MNPSPPPPRDPDLLEEALGLGRGGSPPWRLAFVEDCVETSGAFVLHHFLKRALSTEGDGTVVFLGLAQPFSHYDRVLRKMGCNLSVQRNKNKLHFIDLLNLEFLGERRLSNEKGENDIEIGFMDLYNRILRSIEAIRSKDYNGGRTTIIIDDLSHLEIAAHGSAKHVLDFLQYCRSLTSEMDCSLVILNHEDIHSSDEALQMLSHLDYISDILIKAETLSTGIAADVHGQMTVIIKNAPGGLIKKLHSFQFKVKENGVEFFYPGSRF